MRTVIPADAQAHKPLGSYRLEADKPFKPEVDKQKGYEGRRFGRSLRLRSIWGRIYRGLTNSESTKDVELAEAGGVDAVAV